jgi:hypothetical protein
MTRYLLSVYTNANEAPAQMTEEQMRKGYEQIGALELDMKAANALVFSGRLEAANTATVVRDANGEVLTTDGPFTESKEAIGGFYIIDAADHDAALGWASRTSATIGMPIEVRPFFDTMDPAG